MKTPKKKAFHFEKKGKIEERSVLSYEELPLDEYEEKSKESKKLKLSKKKILFACGIVVILVVAVVLIFTAGSCCYSCSGIQNGEEFTKPISGSKVESGNFEGFAKGLCYASDTGFVYISPKGEVEYKEQLNFSSPIMEAAGSKAIVFDEGKKEFVLFNDKKKTHAGETQDAIYLADITSEGVYGLVTDLGGYTGKLSVYSSDNSIRYGFLFSEFYITSFSLKDNGKEAVVCGVSAEGGALKSAVYVLDFMHEGTKSLKYVNDDVIFDCGYLTDNSVCAVGKEGTYVLKGNNLDELSITSYKGMTLTASDINSDMDRVCLSLSRSGDGRNCDVLIINSGGSVDRTISTSEKITSLSSFKDRLAILADSKVQLYADNGNLLSTHEVSANQKQLRLLSTHWLYVLGVDNITSLYM